MAFVDDYTVWVVGPTAEANRAAIQAIIAGEKNTLVHFTRTPNRTCIAPMTIKVELLKETAKILGVVMDPKLWYKQHIASAATKGLMAAMALKRLCGWSLPRQQGNCFEQQWRRWLTTPPTSGYTLCGSSAIASLNRSGES
jgi:hypothetical protein